MLYSEAIEKVLLLPPPVVEAVGVTSEEKLFKLHREISLRACDLVMGIDSTDPFNFDATDPNYREIATEVILRIMGQTAVPENTPYLETLRKDQQELIGGFRAKNTDLVFRGGVGSIVNLTREFRPYIAGEKEASTNQSNPIFIGSIPFDINTLEASLRADHTGLSYIQEGVGKYILTQTYEARREGLVFAAAVFVSAYAYFSEQRLPELIALQRQIRVLKEADKLIDRLDVFWIDRLLAQVFASESVGKETSLT